MEVSMHACGYPAWLAAASRGSLPGGCSVLVLAATILCVCGIIRWRCSKNLEVQPPGPVALPVLGHLHMLRLRPHQALACLSKRYGPLMYLRLGFRPAIVASSSAMAKLILHTHDNIFAGRPQDLTMPTNALQGSPDIGLSPPGPYWKLMRKLLVTEFLSTKGLDYFRPMRTAETRTLMLSILAAEGSPLCIREMLYTTSISLISRMALGGSWAEVVAGMPNSNKIAPALLEIIGLVGVFNLGDFMPSLAWMDLQGYTRRSKKAAHTIHSFLQDLIHKRRSTRSNDGHPPDYLDDGHPPAFLDVLLSASLKHSELQIGDADITAVIMEMFFAGSETSTITIEWVLAELLVNPKNLKIVQEELEKVVGLSPIVQEADLANLPYLQAVVNETLRLHPPVPLLVPRMSIEACQISSYQIPKDTLVFVNAWAIHRDPNLWDNPLDFCPERFLGANTNALTHQHFKFFPFGAGKRVCPGLKLGLLNVQSVVANLIHAFEWKTLNKPRMHEKSTFVVALEDPLLVVPMPKLPRALFETFI